MGKVQQSKESVCRSTQLALLGQFAAGVANEIRNPLTSVRGFIQLLAPILEQEKNYLPIMLNELDHIESVIREFLIFAKPQAKNYFAYDISNLLLEVIESINPICTTANIKLLVKIESRLPEIPCDVEHVKRLFLHLLQNAIEAMPNGGTLKVSIRMEEPKSIHIRIHDKGCGIPAECMSRLGEPFFTTKENRCGLGLMICYKIMKDHRGSLTIKSKLNRGTTVDLLFPALG